MTEKNEITEIVDSIEVVKSDSNKAETRSKNQLTAIIIASIIALIGIGLWVFQLAGGMVNTNMRNLDSWGIYIIIFMLFVGLSAGGLIISSVPRVFNIKGFGGISKIAIWTSICCTVLAVAFVVVDLGGPLRLWELVVFANWTSPLFWDIIVLTLYFVISIVYLRLTLREESGLTSATTLRVVSAVALVTAILVHTVTAWIFGLQLAHEFWYTALLGPWFVSSALVSGLALVLLVVSALRKTGYLELEQSNMDKMIKLLGVFTVVDLYFFGCDLLTSGFPGGDGADVVAMLTIGPLAGFFWFEILAGIATILIAFVPALRKNPWIVVASVISILAILCKRIQLLVGGFQIENIDYAGVVSGPPLTDVGAAFQSVLPALIYVPSPLEIGVVIGVLALGVALILVGLRFLPLQPVDAEH